MEINERLEKSQARIERSMLLIEQSSLLLVGRPEHATPVLASLGRLVIAEQYGWDRYQAWRQSPES